MISLKTFVQAVHDAIIGASDTLMDKNVELLDKYFEETQKKHKGAQSKDSENTTNNVLTPRNVILEYPVLSSDGEVKTTEIKVPLITMVPLGMSKIEKATLTAEFELTLVDNELQLHFPDRKSDGTASGKTENGPWTNGKLEIIISPQESTEGMKLIVNAYEAALKRQIS